MDKNKNNFKNFLSFYLLKNKQKFIFCVTICASSFKLNIFCSETKNDKLF